MRPVAWMGLASAAAWILVTVTLADRANPEALWGIAGPLTGAAASWMAYVRAHASPERLTKVMIAAFALKLVFFSAYVSASMRLFDLRPAPFAVSFTGAFIALHAMEAVSLRRLVLGHVAPEPLAKAGDLRSPRRERV